MEYDINALPSYLRKDLLALQDALNDPAQATVLDCLQCELLGSINATAIGHTISEELANYLVHTYIYKNKE